MTWKISFSILVTDSTSSLGEISYGSYIETNMMLL